MFRFATTTLLAALITAPALAHDGRRFEVQVVDNQLVAQGYISSGVDDGGGVIRPYTNAIHGHFTNSEIISDYASATLPGFDVLGNANALIGFDLKMTVTGFKKWSTPSTVGPVNLSALDSDEHFEIVYGGAAVNSSSFGPGNDSFTLLPSFNGANGADLDLSYDFYGDNPVGEIYVIESVLSTSAPGVADSRTVYTLLSPDGQTMQQRLHHPSLYVEQTLAVPEPASLGVFALLPLLIRRRRA